MPRSRTTEEPRQGELPFAAPAPSAESLRREVALATPRDRKGELGQFMTPEPIARFMASLFRRASPGPLVLLDPGAGLGALAAATLERWRRGELGKGPLRVIAQEIDDHLRPHLERVLARYRADGAEVHVRGGDFLAHAAHEIEAGRRELTHVILNPPYKKIATTSEARLLCRRAGLETVNLYSAFVGLSLAQLRAGGQLVAILPRSFCNGPYYKPFRQFLLGRAALRRIHLFDARDHAFRDEEVLQENVILLLERDATQGRVTITTSPDASFTNLTERELAFSEVVHPGDADLFIHIPSTAARDRLADARGARCKLADLGLAVSTGPVVDFRMREHLAQMPTRGTVPLLYPAHLAGPQTTWPIAGSKKPNAIKRNADTERWLFPVGVYAVVRRFSSKEEPRRVVASMVTPDALPGATAIGFENHLNVFHKDKAGLPPDIAWGLFAYLNCTAVDDHVRRYSGHTQVNATDLRALPYPDLSTLRKLGRWAARATSLDQRAIDRKVEALLE